jgi:hypothetical protein
MKTDDSKQATEWGPSLDETIVYIERVIGYWSRSFKGAELRYSTTEREALAAKEGLIKFQPFIEGERILLVTDHSALQWARTYENSNRRLAAWGAVFSTYAPGLEIIHRPGRVHSNVDPLSRLPRAAPPHVSPEREDVKSIVMSGDLTDAQEGWRDRDPALKATFAAFALDNGLEGKNSAFLTTRSQAKGEEETKRETKGKAQTGSEPTVNAGGGVSDVSEDVPEEISGEIEENPDQELDALEPTTEYWGALNPPPNIHLNMEEEFRASWVEAYAKDHEFGKLWANPDTDEGVWHPGQRFFKNQEGLLFFRGADYQPRLCVPEAKREFVKTEAHETPLGSAHVSPDRLWNKLTSKFYWRRMKKDIEDFCNSCDVCQKIKSRNFTRYGFLIPNPIPHRPYESISLDLIVNLPWSGDYNAIFVVVDRLTKHASFIPTTSGLTAQGFANLFVEHVASRFGLPDNIIADRDPRWTSDFWTAVSAAIKTKMSLSSSHHPQHDGQTENVNCQLETLLRAYVAEDRSDWSKWLKLLEFSYNSNIHSSIGTTPFLLLYGFEPKAPLDYLLPKEYSKSASMGMRKESSAYLEQLRIHRENARLAIARAQNEQAKFYNKGRRDIPDFKIGSKVLVNPHSLEWVESKGEGAKLVQRWIGPFEVLQKINPKTYRLRLDDRYPGFPIFNFDHLKPYRESTNEGDAPRLRLPETRDAKPASEEYEVEKIVGKRYDKSRRQTIWLVRWKNYGPQHDSWQTRKDLRNAPEMVRAFERVQRARR